MNKRGPEYAPDPERKDLLIVEYWLIRLRRVRGEIEERILRKEDLARAGAIWLFNSVRRVYPARLVALVLVEE